MALVNRAFAVAALTATLACAGQVRAQPVEEVRFAPQTLARQAILIEADTGTVLLQKNADAPFAPASLAKLMTAEAVADALGSGETSLDATFPVTDNAWRTGGAPSRTATMFADVRSRVPVDALLRGLIVQGANDAAIILAEGLDGTEAAFALRMNDRGRALGLSGSQFVNATGLPSEGQRTSARDMAKLAEALEARGDLYPLYAEPEFEWNRILQRNRNPLLRAGIGATGLATGYTEGEGFSIVGQAERDGRRTIVVLAGLESDAIRQREAVKLLGWASESFEAREIYPPSVAVARAAVFGGVASDVPLVLQKSLQALVPRERADLVAARVRYDGPLQAPVEKGTKVGSLDILIDQQVVMTRDLLSGEAVASGSFGERALDAVGELAFGWVRNL